MASLETDASRDPYYSRVLNLTHCVSMANTDRSVSRERTACSVHYNFRVREGTKGVKNGHRFRLIQRPSKAVVDVGTSRESRTREREQYCPCLVRGQV
eukprot:jgi/Picsp_1/6098/NSC_03452-R1_---NA---